MIHVGDKFRVHWIGHEECCEGRLYQVTSVISDCRCSPPEWLTAQAEVPQPPHCHIRADLIECPLKYFEKHGYVFNNIDEDTLCNIRNPDYRLEIVRQPGDQLSLF